MILSTPALDLIQTHIQWRNLINKGSKSLLIPLSENQLDLLVSYIEQLVEME